MLDIDHGTYPFITSSSTTAGGASTGTGVPPTKHRRRARHLEGLLHARGRRAVSDRARRRDRRDGSAPAATSTARSTGRPRRCGWVDAVALRYAARINGLDTIALTKLDVLDGLRDGAHLRGLPLRGEVLTDFPEEERIWHEASRSTRSCRAGRRSPTACGTTRSCRPRRASTSSGCGADRRGLLARLHRGGARRDDPGERLGAHPLVPGAPERAARPLSAARAHGPQDPDRRRRGAGPQGLSRAPRPLGLRGRRGGRRRRRRSPRRAAGLPAVVISRPRHAQDGRARARCRALKTDVPFASVILLTGQGSIDTAVTAMKEGAYDYLTKPVDAAPAAGARPEGGRARSRSLREVALLRRQLSRRGASGRLVGTSPAMQEVYRLIEVAAPTRPPVLIMRRERHRQGAGGAHAPRAVAAGQGAVRGGQLRGDPGDPARERALRPREGRLHRRARAAARLLRAGRRAAPSSSTRSRR